MKDKQIIKLIEKLSKNLKDKLIEEIKTYAGITGHATSMSDLIKFLDDIKDNFQD